MNTKQVFCQWAMVSAPIFNTSLMEWRANINCFSHSNEKITDNISLSKKGFILAQDSSVQSSYQQRCGNSWIQSSIMSVKAWRRLENQTLCRLPGSKETWKLVLLSFLNSAYNPSPQDCCTHTHTGQFFLFCSTSGNTPGSLRDGSKPVKLTLGINHHIALMKTLT